MPSIASILDKIIGLLHGPYDSTHPSVTFGEGEAMSGNGGDDLTEAELHRLADVPSGAAWLAGIAVGLLLIAWFLIWLLIYIPRGSIG
jgi:hypothetical protein